MSVALWLELTGLLFVVLLGCGENVPEGGGQSVPLAPALPIFG